MTCYDARRENSLTDCGRN